MLALIDNLEEINKLPKYEPEKEDRINDDLMSRLQQKFHGIYSEAVGDGKGDSIWIVSDETSCYDEWTELIKSLRGADEDIHNVSSTNSYVEQRLTEYYDELKEMKMKLNVFADELNELLKIDIKFTSIIAGFLSRSEETAMRKVVLQNSARKSKTDEYSEDKICSSCGLIQKQPQTTSEGENSPRKECGKYCSTCGAVEVPSQNSMIRCRHCQGEIIVQGQCSSCDSFDIDKKFKKCDGESLRNSCFSCKFREKRISMSDKKIESWKKSWYFCKHNYREDYECNYCSDCEFTSSCETSCKSHEGKRNMSADSLIPQSDSENYVTGMRSYSCDYDVSSSISSYDVARGKSRVVTLAPSFIEPSELSFDEEYATPREHLSTEDIGTVDNDSDPSFETTVVGLPTEEKADCGKFIEIPEPSDSDEIPEIVPIARQPVFDKICDRLDHLEEALDDITCGNLKLEDEVQVMEKISHQNLNLSMTFRDFVTGITNSMDETEKIETGVEESESSDDFEEALDHITEGESFHDLQSSSSCHPSFECGIQDISLKVKDQSNCETNLAQISEKFIPEDSPKSPEKALVPAQSSCRNWKVNDMLSNNPLMLKGDFARLSFTSVEDRLKLIERETSLLRDNNEIINLFVDDLKMKLQSELDYVHSLCERKTDVSDGTIVGFDVSFYQFTGQITETTVREDTSLEKIEEEVCQTRKTFLEMKFEEVYKKEEQTALELEVFEERLEVEGLIIKEKEDFFACSNISETVEEIKTKPIELSHEFASEKFTTAMKNRENDNLLISIEIEVEKDKKAIRCEYKGNLQKRKLDQDRMIPSITLYPVWTSNRSAALTYGSGDSAKLSEKIKSDCEFGHEEPFFIDMDRDEFVEIKSPNFFSVSSDDEDDEWKKENKRITASAASSIAMPHAIYAITEITLSERPFAVLFNILNKKREFSRVSQIELSQLPESSIIFLQTKEMSSISIINCHEDDSMDEFFEAKSYLDTSFHEKIGSETSWYHMENKSLVKFTPVNIGLNSVGIICLMDQAVPLIIYDEIKAVNKMKSIPDFIPELMTALSLIREIENDVVEVKVDNAIAILPQLESILREHIRNKTKMLKEKSSVVSDTSLDVFMSTLSFIAEDGEETERESPEIESYERLGKMLNLLTGLEEAVKEMNAINYGKTDCEGPGRIYDLLQDLGTRVEGIGNGLDVSAMEKTLELTSELDIAVRDYSSYLLNEDAKMSEPEKEMVRDYIIKAETLKLMKKKIFEIIAFEAQQRDSRIEEDIGKIRILEKENFEVMRFLDTLLDKTLRRGEELDEIRTIALVLQKDIQEFVAKTEETSLSRTSGIKIAQIPTLPSIQEVSSDCRSSSEEENVRQTLSDMIVALDNLKSKAKKTTDRYKEIFGASAYNTSCLETQVDESDLINSTLSEISNTKETEKSQITQFSRIGASTFFITWSKPIRVDGDSPIVGYEIWVNGKVNQRVRNPERLKAVLYSVHPSTPDGKQRINLFALTEDGRRLLLADLRYPDEGGSDSVDSTA